MFLKTSLLFIYTETPLHAGSGSGLGAVDLPIQRERSTGYPIIQSSGIKGALRSVAKDGDEKEAIFGPQKNVDHAGAIAPGDARILLFPIRSLAGVFVWTTSYNLLSRFRRDAFLSGVYPTEPKEPDDAVPELPKEQLGNSALASGKSGLVQVNGNNGVAVLEEYSFDATVDDTTIKWAKWLAKQALPKDTIYTPWVNRLKTHLLILPEDAMRDFLLYSTEIITRVRLNTETKTVETGALWTEEHLPSETLLYVPVHASRLRMDNGGKPPKLANNEPQKEVANILSWTANTQNIPSRIQIGGDETVGRGIVSLRWNGGTA
jgi:CRISPR-associated protein Cmr4